MIALPFELLTRVASYLSKIDMLRCQLVSKEWYMFSVKFLYSHVVIEKSQSSRLYVRTISSSHQLASYLKYVDTKHLFRAHGDNEDVDKHGLLNALILYCPNLLQLNGWVNELSVWRKILYETTQERWPQLQSLPIPNSRSLEIYIKIALHFKNSLTELIIRDCFFIFGPELSRLNVYQVLVDQITGFKNLQSLLLSYESNKSLNDFDTLIEQCSQLRKLKIYLSSTETQRNTVYSITGLINPRYDIREFGCYWKLINHEKQLKYIMQKFPNLQYLETAIGFKERNKTVNCCDRVMADFLLYVTRIPKYILEVEISNLILSNLWARLITENDRFKNVTIQFSMPNQPQDTVFLRMYENIITILEFPLYRSATELSYIRFFSDIGSMIQSLRIESTGEISRLMSISPSFHNTWNTLDWIIQIIQFCPSLKELILSRPSEEFISRGHLVAQNISVEKLIVVDFEDPISSIDFLQYMSLTLPNLKKLHLYSVGAHTDNNWPLVVMMHHTSLDLLIWRYRGIHSHFRTLFEVYIKLSTEKIGLKFYKESNQTGLMEITEQDYNQPHENYRFDITCKDLKEFVIEDVDNSRFKKISCVF